VNPSPPLTFLLPAAFLFGSLVGSFLNVCIHRLPRDLSVRSPARSFCPHCLQTIPWWQNIPLISWLVLRARCAACAKPIPFRYFAVELLTATLFAGFAFKWGPDQPLLLLPYFTLLGLLITATCIDLEHLIIPDEITWGGTAAGLLFSALLPALHQTASPLEALLCSLLGAGVGYGSLRLVVELGRLAFGRKKIVFPEPVVARWVRRDEEADLFVGDELTPWSVFFFRGTEQLRMGVRQGKVDAQSLQAGEARWTLNGLHFTAPSLERSFDLNQTREISFEIDWIVIPREAMGLGDVKFLAALGAFLGWKAALFCIVAACNLGLLVSIPSLMLRRAGEPIPFGPFLASGALLWMANGPGLWQGYLGWLTWLSSRFTTSSL
jgi:leader peptidase (prepilin peptidase)/N-methyltransferase